MDGQISLSDYTFVSVNKGYDIFHEHCRHRGWLKPATDTEPAMWMCEYTSKVFERLREVDADYISIDHLIEVLEWAKEQLKEQTE